MKKILLILCAMTAMNVLGIEIKVERLKGKHTISGKQVVTDIQAYIKSKDKSPKIFRNADQKEKFYAQIPCYDNRNQPFLGWLEITNIKKIELPELPEGSRYYPDVETVKKDIKQIVQAIKDHHKKLKHSGDSIVVKIQ